MVRFGGERRREETGVRVAGRGYFYGWKREQADYRRYWLAIVLGGWEDGQEGGQREFVAECVSGDNAVVG